LTVVSTDTKAPQVLQDKITVKKTEDGKYQVTIVLEDDLSFIAKGTVLQNGKSLATFN
jgi:exoribonuclease II